MNMYTAVFRVCAVAVLLAGCGSETTLTIHPLTVAAAANIQPVIEQAAAQFRHGDGSGPVYQVKTTFGSTKQLAQQVAAGAPVDLFLAADTATVAELAAAGHILPGSVQVYAYGSVVLWQQDTAATGMAALDRESVRRIAIANPDLAPYGAAARAALQQANRWERLQPKLVCGANVAQVATWAQRGEADAAFLPLSLARQHGLAVEPVPGAPHLAQALGIVAHRAPARQQAAQVFVAYLRGPAGAALLQTAGYTLP